MSLFTALWIGWILIFVFIEGWALLRKERGDTLSEKVWAWFSLRGPKDGLPWWRVVLWFLFLAFWAWLSIHFLTGGSFL